jgi:ABC-type phosphate transport system substrate-binding protein
MRARVLVLLALLSAALPAAAEEPGYQIIVHPSNAVQSLSKRDVADLFLKKVTTWPAGTAVRPVEPPEDGGARARFAAHALGKSPGAVKAYWNKLIFAGREVPPVEKRSDEEVVAYVRSTPGAIGYVLADAAVAGVKVVKVKE